MSLKSWARALKRDVSALWIAARDPRVPWYAKALAGAVAAYALSPIDLIPDFIPVLGYLDDLILVPAGIWLVLRLVPRNLMREFRAAIRIVIFAGKRLAAKMQQLSAAFDDADADVMAAQINAEQPARLCGGSFPRGVLR